MKKNILFLFPVYLLTTVAVLLLAVGGSRMVSTIAESRAIERNLVIVIDAGHGGEDGGATSCTGVLESHLNLEIALRLEQLMHLLGYETEMIRTTDISIYTEGQTIAQKKASDLRQRVKIVNRQKNGLLISIHQNLFAESRYSGAQVFYNDQEGAQQLAQQLQSALVSTINPGSNRKSKLSNGVYLMQHIQKIGILVECGFLSNPEEETKLRDCTYQKQICCVIATSVSQYLAST